MSLNAQPTNDSTSAEQVDEKSMLNLPSEIWTKIIERMSPTDRFNFASACDYYNGLEKNTGYRQFSNVEFTSINGTMLIASARSEVFEGVVPSNDIKPFLKHGTTDKLRINGPLSEETSSKLKAAVMSLNFKQLDFEINDNRSIEFLNEMVRIKKTLKEAVVRIAGRNSKDMLMSLPPLEKYSIIFCDVNDENLLDLCGVCSPSTFLNCINSNITAEGLDRAFQKIFTHEEKKLVECKVKYSALVNFLFLVGEFIAHPSKSRIVHRPSGAVFQYEHQKKTRHNCLPGCPHPEHLMVIRMASPASVCDLPKARRIQFPPEEALVDMGPNREPCSIYVGNVHYQTTENELGNFLSQAGAVTNVKIVVDRMSGRSKGFAFCEFVDEAVARNVISMFNGADFRGRSLRVNMAHR